MLTVCLCALSLVKLKKLYICLKLHSSLPFFDGAGSDEELQQHWFALATPPYTKGRDIKGQEGLEVTANSVEEIQQCGK